LQQGSKSCTEYIRLAKQWADQLAAAGKPVDEDDLISYIISGLNPTFNSFVTAFSLAIRTTEMSFADFQTELLSHEKLLDNQQQNTPASETNSFAFYTNKTGPSTFHPSNRKPKFPPKIPLVFQLHLPDIQLQPLGFQSNQPDLTLLAETLHLLSHQELLSTTLTRLPAKSVASLTTLHWIATTGWIMPIKADFHHHNFKLWLLTIMLRLIAMNG
jgi:hypothetical protein